MYENNKDSIYLIAYILSIYTFRHDVKLAVNNLIYSKDNHLHYPFSSVDLYLILFILQSQPNQEQRPQLQPQLISSMTILLNSTKLLTCLT